MNLGHGHRRSVLILWTWTALLSAFVLYPVLTDKNPTYLPFGVVALGIVLFTVLHPSVRRKRAEAVEAALDRPASEQLDPSRPERREAEQHRQRPAATAEQASRARPAALAEHEIDGAMDPDGEVTGGPADVVPDDPDGVAFDVPDVVELRTDRPNG